MPINRIEDLRIILSGQLITSRTETLEEYLKARVKSLGVIGIASGYAASNVARASLYEEGALKKEFKLPSFLVRKNNSLTQPLLTLTFLLYVFSIIYAALKFHRKFDVFIGVATFSTLVGFFLKKMGAVDKLIYYSIDYYANPGKFSFNSLMVWAFRIVDKMCVREADLTWHISERIKEARFKFAAVTEDSYQHITVPLCYDDKLLRFVPIDGIDKNAIGFVGTLSENQGLQMVVNALPDIIKELPQIKVGIIGRGPYENELKAMVKNAGLEKYFIFYGFIKEEERVLDILSHCAIGIAPWKTSPDDNSIYADPGKPKLYAFCGLPTVITNGTIVAGEIDRAKAGISINYDTREFKDAVIKLLSNHEVLNQYKNKAWELAKNYTSENVLGKQMVNSLNYLN